MGTLNCVDFTSQSNKTGMPVNTTVLLGLIAGIALCILEFTVPTAFVEFTMGISAIIVAFVAMVVPSFGIQVAIWLLLSVGLIILSRRLVPSKQSSSIEDAREAKVLTDISPGQVGRVLYEGSSWQARSGEDDVAIAPDETVLVIARKGNTLIVIPEKSLDG